MRIGTWNLAGRWTPAHRDRLASQGCDVWLLTEVREDVALAGYASTFSGHRMAERRHWASVLATGLLEPLPDPHPASAMAEVDGVTYCSSVLPWRTCGSAPPWRGATHAQRMAFALDELAENLPLEALVWGGDWNQALTGREYAGSGAGRVLVNAFLQERGLHATTGSLAHQRQGIATIDHLAVGIDQQVASGVRVQVGNLSDHDMYVIETAS